MTKIMEPNKRIIIHRVIRHIINRIIWVVRGEMTEICQRCGKEHNMVWHASDNLWFEVIGKEGGVLCVNCFDLLFRTTTEKDRRFLYWSCKEECYPE